MSLSVRLSACLCLTPHVSSIKPLPPFPSSIHWSEGQDSGRRWRRRRREERQGRTRTASHWLSWGRRLRRRTPGHRLLAATLKALRFNISSPSPSIPLRPPPSALSPGLPRALSVPPPSPAFGRSMDERTGVGRRRRDEKALYDAPAAAAISKDGGKIIPA